MTLTSIIKQPIITEKTLASAQQNRYTFEVAKDATKGQIKQAIASFFNVKVIKVTTAKISGKRVRTTKRRQEKVKPDRKKAFITLKAGDKIDLFHPEEK